MNYYRFVKKGIGIYEAVAKESPKDDPRRINKPDGSWLPKKGTEYPGAISFWSEFGLDKYIKSGLLDWHTSILKDNVEVTTIERPNEILYEDEYQIIVRPEDVININSISLEDFLGSKRKNYIGLIIEESLKDKSILKELEILDLKVTDDINPADRWHIYRVLVNKDQIKEIQKVIDVGKWYIDFKSETDVVIVYKDRIFEYKKGDVEGRERAVEFGRLIGVPEEQLGF